MRSGQIPPIAVQQAVENLSHMLAEALKAIDRDEKVMPQASVCEEKSLRSFRI